MEKYKAKIFWIRAEDGGRTTIPQGDKYAPIIKVLGEAYFEEFWSAFVVNVKYIGENITEATIEYLSELAPNNLRENVEFELYEGAKNVAKGTIVHRIIN